MAYADDLLGLARHLANLEPANPRQACLRRAVSTAYCALFHLLIAEATLDWGRPELRSEVGRVFGRGEMKSASVEMRSELDAHFKKNSLLSNDSSICIRSLAPSFKCNGDGGVRKLENDSPGISGNPPQDARGC